jgi:hypothetical protein
MKTVYVLIEHRRMPEDRSPESGKTYEDVVGVVSSYKVACKFKKPLQRGFIEFDVDDPEIIQRIKEMK